MPDTPTYDNKTAGSQYGHDDAVYGAIHDHCTRFDLGGGHALRIFPTLVRRKDLARFYAYSDLVRSTLDIPGDIIEIGVHRGFTLFTFANVLEIFSPNNRSKIVYGFDTWSGIKELSIEDGAPNPEGGKFAGAFATEGIFEGVTERVQIFDSDRHVPWKSRIRLIRGQAEDTLPQFLKDNPSLRVSLLNLDADLFKPTDAALRLLQDRLLPGAKVIFDNYSNKYWEGETSAADAFAKRHDLRLRSFDFSASPLAYVEIEKYL